MHAPEDTTSRQLTAPTKPPGFPIPAGPLSLSEQNQERHGERGEEWERHRACAAITDPASHSQPPLGGTRRRSVLLRGRGRRAAAATWRAPRLGVR